jgi:hypothetical protein
MPWTDKCDRDYLDMAHIYGFAEKLQDTVTKNTIVRRMFDTAAKPDQDGYRFLPSGKAIKVFYESTPDSSPIRELLPHMWSTVMKEALVLEYDDLPKAFLAQLAGVLIDQRNPKAKNSAKTGGVEKYLEQE